MKNPIIILGASAIGRIAKEIFEMNENVVYGFLDDDNKLHGTEVDGVAVLGSTDDDGFLKLIGKKCEAFVANDDRKIKRALTEMLNEIRHVQPVNAIHSHSYLAKHSGIGHGNLIDRGVYIYPGIEIGNHCIIHAHAILGVNSKLGNFIQIGAGSTIGTDVVIEDEVFIGPGVTIVAGVTIGKQARIGAGSVVVGSVKAGETMFGNPAQKVN